MPRSSNPSQFVRVRRHRHKRHPRPPRRRGSQKRTDQHPPRPAPQRLPRRTHRLPPRPPRRLHRRTLRSPPRTQPHPRNRHRNHTRPPRPDPHTPNAAQTAAKPSPPNRRTRRPGWRTPALALSQTSPIAPSECGSPSRLLLPEARFVCCLGKQSSSAITQRGRSVTPQLRCFNPGWCPPCMAFPRGATRCRYPRARGYGNLVRGGRRACRSRRSDGPRPRVAVGSSACPTPASPT